MAFISIIFLNNTFSIFYLILSKFRFVIFKLFLILLKLIFKLILNYYLLHKKNPIFSKLLNFIKYENHIINIIVI